MIRTPSRYARILLGRTVACIAALASSCGGDPVGPTTPVSEVVIAGGDAQFGTTGQTMETPMHAQVRVVETAAPRADVTVLWTVEEGSATLLENAAVPTDSNGSAFMRFRFGTTPGNVRVRATVQEPDGPSVVFDAYLVDRPELTALSSTTARAGDTIRVTGRNFSTVPLQNVVLFSGIRGRVTSAATTELGVEVPRCLPTRTVDVTVQLGSMVSLSRSLSVQEIGERTDLDPGEFIDVEDPNGLTCLRLRGGAGVSYLVTVGATGTVGAARHGFVLRGLSENVGGASSAAVGAVMTPLAPPGHVVPFGERFEQALREREADMVRATRLSVDAAAPVAAVPSVGERRTFRVRRSEEVFDDVSAVAQHVGARVALYVDEAAPAGGLDQADLASLARAFDDVSYPTVTDAFGSPSDLDGNERVIVLFTPKVNQLTPRGTEGFVGGFFFGLDLLDREGSNGGEIFYSLVPDATGEFADPRSREVVLAVLPAILAHEFQHMVHFNERVLVGRAEAVEALWLSEGLAQMAEELVAREYESAGDGANVTRFRDGNRVRAVRYLGDPSSVSLIVATGQGTLVERGAGWLYVLYLADRAGGNSILGQLTRTTRTGIANVTSVMATPWDDLFADWSAALYLDDRGPLEYPFEYPTVNLRTLANGPGTSYPLVPQALGASSFSRSGSLWSSSSEHYLLTPPVAGSVVLRLGGESGGNAPADAGLRLRIVRLF